MMKRKKQGVLAALLSAVLLLGGLGTAPATAYDGEFTDVGTGDWFYAYVAYAYDDGLMSGASTDSFAPYSSMTRGQFVAVLGRMEGIDDGGADTVFTDVSGTAYYAAHIQWANENDIVNGTGDTTFSPDADITREAMATLLDRYLDYLDAELEDSQTPAGPFADAGSISTWAGDSVENMRQKGIVTGDDYGNYNPKANMIRAEGAAALVRIHMLLTGGTLPEVPEEDPDLQRSRVAYADLLTDIHDNPGRYVFGYDSAWGGIEEDRFALADINGDGLEELIVPFSYSPAAMAYRYAGVWAYDRQSGTVYEYGTLGADVVAFYTNGTVKVDASHNHSPGMTIWPYDLARYDASAGEFEYYAGAYCADADYGTAYSPELDLDNDGVIYYFEVNDDPLTAGKPLTLAQYNAMVEQYIPAGMEIPLNWMNITPANISTLA